MEFEELQKIWDTQNNKPMFAIDEAALHRRIESKRTKTVHIANISELVLIGVNIASAIFIATVNISAAQVRILFYIMAAWMVATALYVLVSRVRRVGANKRYDRSMQGDLDHALSVASYQVVLSQLMRWNIVPIALFSIAGLWMGGKSIGIALSVTVVFLLAYFVSGWEQNIYKKRKTELEMLSKKLQSVN